MIQNTSLDMAAAIAGELALEPKAVRAVTELLAQGNTVPFVARYRKEATGGLDEVAIRNIQEQGEYLAELEKRREVVLASIEEQGALDDELRARILACGTKAALEDLYLPYKPKRRTRGSMAREKGLGPLADMIKAQPMGENPLAAAAVFIDADRGVEDAAAALEGARDIVAEDLAHDAGLRSAARDLFAREGVLFSRLVKGKEAEGAKFKDYFEYSEKVASIPSHRFLAVRRGEREGVLKVKVGVDEEALVARALKVGGLDPSSGFAEHLEMAAADGVKRLLAPSVESDVRVDLKLRADREAVDVFASNLRALLLASPLGEKAVVGIDPGLRTGCKCAAVDGTGAFEGNMVFNIVAGTRAEDQGRKDLKAFLEKHRPAAVAVGNGTGGREAERFARGVVEAAGMSGVIVVPVSEAGASVYSASPLAAKEFPDLDLTVRGAISIARRLQDPLAELVKIEPKAIGVGQYQHDVHQPLLSRKLDEVIESCVNAVGVEVNTASAPLLSRVAGIGPKTAEAIVELRSARGRLTNKRQLLKARGLGPKAFKQAAGFLRVRLGDNPLDASAVHPERYSLVERMASDLGVDLVDLVGSTELARGVEISRYIDGDVGEPTLRDIVAELEKPGRDPRSEFEPPAFRDDVNRIEDLEVGMELEGVVTNVTNFGAFVDVGVHRDGLVHVSQLADRFVKDPADVVAAGDKIKVRVLEVDLERQRISFTAKTGSPGGGERGSEKARRVGGPAGSERNDGRCGPRKKQGGKFSYNPFASLGKKK